MQQELILIQPGERLLNGVLLVHTRSAALIIGVGAKIMTRLAVIQFPPLRLRRPMHRKSTFWRPYWTGHWCPLSISNYSLSPLLLTLPCEQIAFECATSD